MKCLTLISALLLNSIVNGQIVFVNTNDTINIDCNNDPSFNYGIDLNLDGINDFILQLNQYPTYSIFAMYGDTDSSDIVHRYFYFPGSISGYQAINMTDSTISENSDWMAGYSIPTPPAGNGLLHSTFGTYISEFLNQNVYFGVRFFVEDNDFIFKPHYACIDATLTLNDRLIIHGWYYQSQPNIPITCADALLVDNSSVLELLGNDRCVIKYHDLTGREVVFTHNTFLIATYNDGSTEKIYVIK